MTNHIRFYVPANSAHLKRHILSVENHVRSKYQSENRPAIQTEYCYHLILSENEDSEDFIEKNQDKLRWLLIGNPFDQEFRMKSDLTDGQIIEIGPRHSFKTAFCTAALSVLNSSGVFEVVRIERSLRYSIRDVDQKIDGTDFLWIAGDRMTECIYDENTKFELAKGREDFTEIDVFGDPKNLDKANSELGLAFDKTDLEYYKDLFINQIKRNPTDVELFDLAQSDSEHSRHWFFRGRMIIDGKERECSLMDSVKSTLEHSNRNSLIAFNDNSRYR
ncbi:hypothetical protein WR25_19630 [Diploscapter pachys]|uniref:Phosphoribosylformylglycinamidine synthase linker domain-containing protein n=1 Tax=Diploscapter pachys TaxID=2018661 RepID=A0A2A2KZJ1_9BILA|nr:hypothetical protein WR25_19630 [Diploscapter pachys]